MICPRLLVAALLLAGCGSEPPADRPSANIAAPERYPAPATPAPAPDKARVRLETSAGAIVIEIDGRRAPVTAANFLAYVDQHRFDGASFYRAAQTRGRPGRGFVQGGIRHSARRALPPIAHEPTSETGLRHGEGAISMARTDPGTAMGDFFITTAAMPSMDSHGRDAGFAVFGRVVEGMDVVRRILAAPVLANAGSGSMRGQMLAAPVRIVSARREPERRER